MSGVSQGAMLPTQPRTTPENPRRVNRGRSVGKAQIAFGLACTGLPGAGRDANNATALSPRRAQSQVPVSVIAAFRTSKWAFQVDIRLKTRTPPAPTFVPPCPFHPYVPPFLPFVPSSLPYLPPSRRLYLRAAYEVTNEVQSFLKSGFVGF